MKRLLLTVVCLSMFSSLCGASETSHQLSLPPIRDGVADLTNYDHEEYVAMKLLWRLQSGAVNTKTSFQPVITNEGANAARNYLLKMRFDYPNNNEFKQKRAIEKLDTILKNGDEPFESIAAITHIRIDFTEHMGTTYDFEKSAFPFRPESRGPYSLYVSLYDQSQLFKVERIRLDDLSIESELAERWKSENGRLIAVCRVGKGFSPRSGMPALRVECEKIEFRSRQGELLQEISIPPSRRDIDKDFTIEEASNIFDSEPEDSDEKIGNEEKNTSNHTPLLVVLFLLLTGSAWVVMKIRSAKRKQNT